MEIKQVVKYIGYEYAEYDTEAMALESFKLADKREAILRHIEKETRSRDSYSLKDFVNFFVDNYDFERKK